MVDLRNKEKYFFSDDVIKEVELPDYERLNQEYWEKLKKKPIIIIEEKKKEGVKTMSKFIKPLAFLVILILGFIAVFMNPDPDLMVVIVGVASQVAGFFGIKNFRDSLETVKKFYQSKTKIGALLIVAATLLLVVAPLFFPLSAVLVSVITTVASIGGGLSLVGIYDALQ